MTVAVDDERFMRQALRLAKRASGRTSPNPVVGAVVVRSGKVVGTGYHRAAGKPHAEVIALRSARNQARGAVIYTTLEPCAHQGRTPPCVAAIRRAGIKRVVAAMRDPDPRTNGRGFRALRHAGIAVATGVLEQDAAAVNEGFTSRVRRGRPFVVVKLAMTLDGRVAVPGRRYLVDLPALRYVYSLGWISGARHKTMCILANLDVAGTRAQVMDALRKSPQVSRVVRRLHLTVQQAGTAFTAGFVSACS